MGTKTPAIVAACAGTILAAAAIVTLTAAAQEYVLGRERDVAIQLAEIKNSQASQYASLNAKVDQLILSVQQVQMAQTMYVTRTELEAALSSQPKYVTQAELEAAMGALAEGLIAEIKKAKQP